MSVFIDRERERFGVEPICETLGVSASAYYQRASGERSARRIEDERLLELIRRLHERNYFAYGSWRMWKALQRTGEEVGRGHVERLMRANGIRGAKRRSKRWRTTTPNAEAYRPPDLVQRDFTASRSDEIWYADFTYLRCWEGGVLRVRDRRLQSGDRRLAVRRSHAHRPRPRRAADGACPARAGRRRRAHPSQRRRQQYTSLDYSQTLDDHGVLASIGTVGDAYDNATAESFVDSVKTELIRDRVWRSRSQLELAIVEYVAWFNTERIHTSLGGFSPAEYAEAHPTR